MTQRFPLPATIPEGYAHVMALETHVRSRIGRELLELVKLRASMLNGCTYCVDMHGADLISAGVDPRRVLAVAAWRDSTWFSAGERAALALTDAVTELDHDGVPDAVWDTAVDEHGDGQAADLVLAIGVINLWNRLAVTAQSAPPPLGSTS